MRTEGGPAQGVQVVLGQPSPSLSWTTVVPLAVNQPPCAMEVRILPGGLPNKGDIMEHVKSTLGNFLRWDREDYVRDSRYAARFATMDEAEAWIRLTYGRNGVSYFYSAHVKDRDDAGDDED